MKFQNPIINLNLQRAITRQNAMSNNSKKNISNLLIILYQLFKFKLLAVKDFGMSSSLCPNLKKGQLLRFFFLFYFHGEILSSISWPSFSISCIVFELS